MKPYKFPCILALVIISFFSYSCSARYMPNFSYDIPTPEIHNYLDKAVCLYPAPGVDPTYIEPWFHKPALTYCSPQFKSVDFASDKEDARNIEADFYIQISLEVLQIHMQPVDFDYTKAKIEARYYDSNWKLLLTSETYGIGNTNPIHSVKESEEAVHKVWGYFAKKLATELNEYNN